MGRLPFEHAVEGTAPFQLPGPVGPVTFRVPLRALVDGVVTDMSVSVEGFGRGKAPLFVEESFNSVSRHDSGY